MARRQQQPAAEIGLNALIEWDGVIREEFLVALQGTKGQQVYREMRDNSPTIGAVLFAIEMIARQAEVTIKPGGETRADEEAAEFVRTNVDDMSQSWDDTLTEILSMLPFGWAYHEIVYKIRQGWNRQPGSGSYYDDGLLGWRKLPLRAQTSLLKWELDAQGGIKGMWQQPPHGQAVFLPIERCLLFRTKTHKNNPEGRSLLRNAYLPWYYGKRIAEVEAIGIERELVGYPVIYLPGDQYGDSTKLSQWKQAITRIRRDEQAGMILPSERDEKGNLLYELVLVSGGGERQIDTDVVLKRYDTLVTQSMLADFLQLGHTDVGAKAVAEPKMGLFLSAMNTVLESVAAVFNRHAIPRLVGLNGFTVDLPPKLVFSKLDTDDLLAWSEAISKLSGAGMAIFPDPQIENVVRGKLGLPQMTDEEIAEREQEIEQDEARQAQMEEDAAVAQSELDRARADRERAMASATR